MHPLMAHYITEFPRSSPSQVIQPSVKIEASSSPDLPPETSLNYPHIQYSLEHWFLESSSSSGSASLPITPVTSSATSSASLYRSASDLRTFGRMESQSWLPPAQDSTPGPSSLGLPSQSKFDFGSMQQSTVTFSDEFDDDVSELIEFSGGTPGLGSTLSAADKAIRRRSSKACDQCRKSKCKCERSTTGEPCRSCITLGTPCTFLGPSRKRGPPKGYIDAIEARLHQTEALLGVILSASDDRAQSLLSDIAKDPLAKEIINRVDNSVYGPQGRKRGDIASGNKARSPQNTLKPSANSVDLQSTHPSNEWQDHVSSMLRNASVARGTYTEPAYNTAYSAADKRAPPHSSSANPGASSRPSLRVRPPSAFVSSSDEQSPRRRQRRRTGDSTSTIAYTHPSPPDSSSPIDQEQDQVFLARVPYESLPPPQNKMSTNSLGDGRGASQSRTTPTSTESNGSQTDEELPDAVGQLSLNEDEEVRYHGKASGLYLLGDTERVDTRNMGGIWRFPKARVWPPVPEGQGSVSINDDAHARELPVPEVQRHLLELYFTYVHPSFPIIHKKSFFESYTPISGASDPVSNSSHGDPVPSAPLSTRKFHSRQRRVPALLLLTMFAVASRYSTTPSFPADAATMWTAGDEYLDRAKVIMDSVYASSRTTTCQALLLMGYREIGIGAMAQAWIYIGMAIRMAQDLGLHRSADGWARADLGGRLFSESELHERKRVWYGCVIMDKYVSTYIGRPLAISEKDFDTPLPEEDEIEEHDIWKPHSSQPNHSTLLPPAPGRIISCFNASASLSNILGLIIQGIYAIRPTSSRHTEAQYLEGLLDKWYLNLPEQLRYDPAVTKNWVPAPHILTLHMQYWCTVLLLHRSFIRHGPNPKNRNSPDVAEGDVRTIIKRSYELCAAAAHHITTIASAYIEFFCVKRCAVFLCYYVFTASIMHVVSLSSYPDDPQARLGLTKCMDTLRRMEIVWPSAARALELLRGSKFAQHDNLMQLTQSPPRHKRTAEQCLDDTSNRNRANDTPDYLALREQTFGFPNNPQANSAFSIADNGTSARMPYFSSYERWASDSTQSIPFSGPLSTSVLPQMYSTGLADERTVSSRSRGQAPSAQPSPQSPRYPQYWNDYATFPQLGSAYSEVQTHSPVATQPTPGQIYLGEQYPMYGNNNPQP